MNAPALRPLVASAIARQPFCAGPWWDDIKALIERPEHLRAAYAMLKAAVAPSRFLRNAYIRNGFTIPLELSPFGIDIDRSAKPVRTDNEVRVGFIGQLAHHKGAHILLHAQRKLADKRLRVDVWGDENQDPSYASQLRQIADGQQTTFRGTFAVEETAGILAELDVLALPSTWHENAPLILLQALATHTPIIVSDVEGLTEFMSPGISGFSFPRADVDALAQILRTLVDAPGRAAAMSLQTRYDRTTHDMARDIVDLYNRHSDDARMAM